MANEATIRSSLLIRKGSVFYQSQPTAFLADVTGTKGPVPGAITVDNEGTDVDFSELTTPGLCRFQNLSSSGHLEVGIWDPQTFVFYPLLELLAGESYIVRLSRNLQEQYANTGTGTSAAENRVRIKGHQGATVALIEAFEQ